MRNLNDEDNLDAARPFPPTKKFFPAIKKLRPVRLARTRLAPLRGDVMATKLECNVLRAPAEENQRVEIYAEVARIRCTVRARTADVTVLPAMALRMREAAPRASVRDLQFVCGATHHVECRPDQLDLALHTIARFTDRVRLS